MKIYYNKALMYQSFLRGKWTLFAGMLLFTLATILEACDNIYQIKNTLSTLTDDRVDLNQLPVILSMLLILSILYLVITGFNKRSNLTYFHSGPFNKKEIKLNEILFLVFALLIMIGIYAYIYICLYFKNRVVIDITYGYFISFFINIFRMLLDGLLFIGYIIFMDSLFTNLILAIVAMIVTPLSIIWNIFIVLSVVEHFNIYSNFLSKLLEYLYDLCKNCLGFIFNFYDLAYEINVIGKWQIISVIFCLIIVIALYMLIHILNKKFTVNNMNKLFLLPVVSKVTIWFSSYTVISSVISLIILINDRKIFSDLNTSSSFTGVIYFIIFIAITLLSTNFLSEKISNKLKKIL